MGARVPAYRLLVPADPDLSEPRKLVYTSEARTTAVCGEQLPTFFVIECPMDQGPGFSVEEWQKTYGALDVRCRVTQADNNNDTTPASQQRSKMVPRSCTSTMPCKTSTQSLLETHKVRIVDEGACLCRSCRCGLLPMEM